MITPPPGGPDAAAVSQLDVMDRTPEESIEQSLESAPNGLEESHPAAPNGPDALETSESSSDQLDLFAAPITEEENAASDALPELSVSDSSVGVAVSPSAKDNLTKIKDKEDLQRQLREDAENGEGFTDLNVDLFSSIENTAAPAPRFSSQSERQIEHASITTGLTLVAVICVVMALFLGRQALVQMWPSLNAIYSALGIQARPGDGLRLTNSGMHLLRIAGIETLVVKGYISNTSEKTRDVPNLRLQLSDTTGQIVQNIISAPPRSSLAPGEEVDIEIKLQQPDLDAAKNVDLEWAE
jgi:hypothetical protein